MAQVARQIGVPSVQVEVESAAAADSLVRATARSFLHEYLAVLRTGAHAFVGGARVYIASIY